MDDDRTGDRGDQTAGDSFEDSEDFDSSRTSADSWGASRGPRTAAEGVRIIGAKEAAEAIDSGQVAPRTPEGAPRFGDPTLAPTGPRPPLRFPGVDPSQVVKPPVSAPAFSSRDRVSKIAAGESPYESEAPVEDSPSGSFGLSFKDFLDPTARARSAATRADEDPEPPPPRKGDTLNPRSAPSWVTPTWSGTDTAEVAALPHWTEPPTGEHPRLVLEPRGDEPTRPPETWSSLTSGPRWRDTPDDWDDTPLPDILRVPKRSTTSRPERDEMLPSATASRFDRSAGVEADYDRDPTDDEEADEPNNRTPGGIRRSDQPASASRSGAWPTTGSRSGPDAPENDDEDSVVPITARSRLRSGGRISSQEGRSASAPPRTRGRSDPSGGSQRRVSPTAEGGSASPRGRGSSTGGGLGPPTPPRKPTGSGPKLGDLSSRTLTGVVVAGVVISAAAAGPAALMVVVGLVLTAASGEFFAGLRSRGYQPATLVGVAGSAGMIAAVYFKGLQAVAPVLFLVVVFTLLWYLLGVVDARPTMNLSVTLLGVCYVGLLGSFAAALLRGPNGVAVLIGALLVAVAHDVGSYFVGRAAGQRPLAPAISPNKTVEGLLGGTAACLAVSVVVGAFGPFPISKAIVGGLMVAVMAPLGDLSESMLKRDLGLKDMGRSLPGHGGVLDRIDALLFVIPSAYFLARLLDLA